jgi:transcriptional regulator of arginine metabolism
MVKDECTKLAAGVAAGAEHSDGYSIHPECIIMRIADVNPGPDANCRAWPEHAIVPAVEKDQGMRKRDRHQAILELVGSHTIANQEELRQLLAERGWHVTQATLSRDLRELGVVRAPTTDGARYLLPQMLGSDEGKPSLEALLPQLFDDVDGVSELLVLHTLPGGAQPIAEAIDAQGWPEIIGTIGGENTILIVCRSEHARLALTERLRGMAVRRTASRT